MDLVRRLAHTVDRRGVPDPPAEDGSRPVDTPHGRLQVRRRGSGPVVVVAPDPPNGLDHIEPLVAALAADHDVIAFEPPGFGWSTAAPTFDWSLDATADALGDLLDEEAVDRAVLVLPCLLGLVAARFADRHPDRVAGLVLSQACAWPETRQWLRRIDRRFLLRTPLVGQAILRMQEPTVRDRWYHVAEPDAAKRLQYTRLSDRRARKGARFPLASALQGLPARDPFEHARLDVPAVILWGEHDRSHRVEDAPSLQRVLPEAEVRIVPGAGHFPDLTDPQRVVDAVAHVRATAATHGGRADAVTVRSV